MDKNKYLSETDIVSIQEVWQNKFNKNVHGFDETEEVTYRVFRGNVQWFIKISIFINIAHVTVSLWWNTPIIIHCNLKVNIEVIYYIHIF